jgi:hypothetical protein
MEDMICERCFEEKEDDMINYEGICLDCEKSILIKKDISLNIDDFGW